MTIQEAFDILLRTHGTHSAAARALSINISYYRDLRNGRAAIPNRTAAYIIMQAQTPAITLEDTAEDVTVTSPVTKYQARPSSFSPF